MCAECMYCRDPEIYCKFRSSCTIHFLTQKKGNLDSEHDTAQENSSDQDICEKCSDNLLYQMGVKLEVFLDSLELPVVVVNREGIIVTGNDKAKTLLKKELPEIAGYRSGDVFECAYARLPEGCGETVHCSGCTIRRTVFETYGTGRSLLRVPATLYRNTQGNPEKIKLLISTERIDDLVLLRIDEMEDKDAAQLS